MVKIWEELTAIPTYGIGLPNKNPMFLEKRVYQGSSGKVYPLPVIDKIKDEKTDKKWIVVFLENDWIQVQIMPELGGRVRRAIDKTNGYDFVYFNQVIKPALVGLAGPWISGGIEFNWPQHHRPSTYGRVEHFIEDASPDRVTLWVSEIDRLHGTKAATGFTLREDRACLEIETKLYNPTGEAQSFLWWANPAVAAHSETQSVFPPDVTAVMDHGKRDVSGFPIATGTYYKTDYSSGVDISRYRNIPVPTSYMALKSNYDFMGSYDSRARAGILHVADHQVSPGKKQWTWGCGDFGVAWDRNLTDEDGPYIEIMTGVFTDNQPDFTWIEPYEEKVFTQRFMPYKEVGAVKNATADAAIGISKIGTKAVAVVSAFRTISGARLIIGGKTGVLAIKAFDLTPEKAVIAEVLTDEPESDLSVSLQDSLGHAIVEYKPQKAILEPYPEPAEPLGLPEELPTTESLYLAGLHLEQYRHATYDPKDYYLEGLRRDKNDSRLNGAYGNLLLKQGLFHKAETHFRIAVEALTKRNLNPIDGEPFYNLAKALQWQGKLEEAFDFYYKAAWSGAQQSRAYLKLGQIKAQEENCEKALAFGKRSLEVSPRNLKARNLVSFMLKKTGRLEEAKRLNRETLSIDITDLFARRELGELDGLLGTEVHNSIFLAESYREIGGLEDAILILEDYIKQSEKSASPMALYYLADYSGDVRFIQRAEEMDSYTCFPNSLRDMEVLEKALSQENALPMAMYYLGNLLYDKGRREEAMALWEKSIKIKGDFPTSRRNLALAYAKGKNPMRDLDYCVCLMQNALDLDPTDSRVFFELAELWRDSGKPLDQIVKDCEKHLDLVLDRDDACIALCADLNCIGRHEDALKLILRRKFHPWEGGEGKVTTQHKEARLGLARQLIAKGKNEEAVSHLLQALEAKESFGEGTLPGTPENNIRYCLGLAYEKLDPELSRKNYELASGGQSEPAAAIYYNDQPPHMVFYQGLAFLKLGEEAQAKSRFNKLVAFARKNMLKAQRYDFFAVSLPDFGILDVDLDQRNKIHCAYMMALGKLGLGEFEEAKRLRESVLEMSPGHAGISLNFDPYLKGELS